MIDDILLEAEDKMDKAVTVAQEDFAAIRTGRANPAMFSKIVVDYYGAPTPLQQLASFAAPEARMMIVTPMTSRSSTRSSELSGTPTSGSTPPPTATSCGWRYPS